MNSGRFVGKSESAGKSAAKEAWVLPTHHEPAEHDRANSSQDESGLTERVYNARHRPAKRGSTLNPLRFGGLWQPA
jgi:hypothetical protein